MSFYKLIAGVCLAAAIGEPRVALAIATSHTCAGFSSLVEPRSHILSENSSKAILGKGLPVDQLRSLKNFIPLLPSELAPSEITQIIRQLLAEIVRGNVDSIETWHFIEMAWGNGDAICFKARFASKALVVAADGSVYYGLLPSKPSEYPFSYWIPFAVRLR